MVVSPRKTLTRRLGRRRTGGTRRGRPRRRRRRAGGRPAGRDQGFRVLALHRPGRPAARVLELWVPAHGRHPRAGPGRRRKPRARLSHLLGIVSKAAEQSPADMLLVASADPDVRAAVVEATRLRVAYVERLIREDGVTRRGGSVPRGPGVRRIPRTRLTDLGGTRPGPSRPGRPAPAAADAATSRPRGAAPGRHSVKTRSSMSCSTTYCPQDSNRPSANCLRNSSSTPSTRAGSSRSS